ncbi:MAG TPA: MerR family transcriptional regulator [Minicystis sp.]|nr:MerR family transcriptional regulator [Minicystis sp.]
MTTIDLRSLPHATGNQAPLARIAPSTIRMYVHAGLLPRAVLRGRNTRYDDGYLLRIRAVRYLLHTERLTKAEARRSSRA